MAENHLQILLSLVDNFSESFKKANAGAMKEVEALKKVSEATSKSTEAMGDSFKDFGKTVNETAGKAQESVKGITDSYDDLSTAILSSSDDYENISNAIKQLENETKKLESINSSAYGDMSKAITASRSTFENFAVEVNKRTEQMKASLTSLSEKLDESGKQLKALGRDISQLGGAISLVGGAITAIFIKALADSTKYSKETQVAIQNLNIVSTQFSVILGNAVIPIINKLTSFIQLLLNTLNAIDPEIRTSILQFILWGGIILTTVGSLTFLVGKLIIFLSGIRSVTAAMLAWTAANITFLAPMIAITAVIAGIIFLMLKFKPIADTIVSAFEVMFRVLQNGFLAMSAYVNTFVALSLGAIGKVFEALAKVPGPSQKAFTTLANAMINASGDARVLAQRDLNGIIVNSQKIGDILTSGQGQWSTVFQDMKTKAIEAKDAIAGVLTGIKTPQVNQDESIVNLLKAETELKNFNTELDKQKNLFLTGQISAEEYYRILRESQTGVIGANQQLSIELERLAKATQDASFSMAISLTQLKIKALELKSSIEQGIGQAFAKMIVEGKSFADSMKELFKSIAEQFIAEVGRMIAKWLTFIALKGVGKLFGIPFSEGSGNVQPQAFAQGGFVNPLRLASGTDTIPAMLTPGEIVVPKSMSDSIRNGDLSLSGPKEKQGDSFGDVQVNIYYPKMTNKEEMMELVNNIGFEIQKQMRYAG